MCIRDRREWSTQARSLDISCAEASPEANASMCACALPTCVRARARRPFVPMPRQVDGKHTKLQSHVA
eukprot:8604862-Alexandrium_andersonii.AAC.1